MSSSDNNNKKFLLYISNTDKKIVVHSGTSIAEAIRALGLHFETPCGGHGLCGGCLVKVTGGSVEVSEQEKKLISEELLKEGYRLACRARKFTGDVSVSIPERKKEVNLKAIPQKIRGKYGFSVDLGTTTIAMSLINIDEKLEIGSLSLLNPQTGYGSDVITRATLVMENPDALGRLRKITLDTISTGFNRLMQECRVMAEDIVKISIAGNSIMEHIILGISPVPLTVAPFQLQNRVPRPVKAMDFGLSGFKNAMVVIFPMIGANAGGDTVAGIYYLDLWSKKEPAVLLDIGTNVEMVLVINGRIYVTSSPAGPAFEGGEITFGMRAEDGAIEGVEVDGHVMRFRVKGGGRPKGICGSGLISLVAELIKSGVIDSTGYIKDRESISSNLALRVQPGERGNIFVLHRDTKISMYITQNDIRQLQLAKAALRAGIEILLKKTGTRAEDVEKVYMAGAFGVSISEDALFQIRMLPEGLRGKLEQCGDTALGGAKKLILDDHHENALKEILDRSQYFELSKEKDFEKEFINQMNF